MEKKKFKVVLDVFQTENGAYEVQLDSFEVCDRTSITSTEIESTHKMCEQYGKELTDSHRDYLIRETDTGFA